MGWKRMRLEARQRGGSEAGRKEEARQMDEGGKEEMRKRGREGEERVGPSNEARHLRRRIPA